MASNVQSRVIIGLCMDKERDEELLNFLSSQKNKSEYIRTLLNKHLSNLKNGVESKDTDTHIVLKDISITLKNILFSLSEHSSPLINSSNKRNTQTIDYTAISEDLTSTKQDVDTAYFSPEEDTVEEDEADLILKAIAQSAQGF